MMGEVGMKMTEAETSPEQFAFTCVRLLTFLDDRMSFAPSAANPLARSSPEQRGPG